MIWNKNLLYQINDVWYHITKLYLVKNEKSYKIKLNHFFYKRRPIKITLWVLNKVRLLGSVWHTPTQFFWKYHPPPPQPSGA